jgi:hypothetical protein
MLSWSWPEELATLHQRFLSAEPYPHVVLDGVFPAETLADVYAEIPKPNSELWTIWGSGWKAPYDNRNQKRGISSLFLLGESTANFMRQLNSRDFLSDVCMLTGVHELAGDDTFNGGGLHCTGRGGRLRVHVDKVRHPRPDKFDQAVNLILFINPVWLPEYGGHLELWSRDGSSKCVSIEPTFNRLVLFQSDRRTFHGHPEALQCPEGLFRSSIAAYYYIRRKLEVPPSDLNDIGWRL